MKQQETIPFPDEIIHLEQTLVLLGRAWRTSADSVERYDAAYNQSKRYLVDFRHEIDPREIFQSELLLGDTERSGIIAVRERDRLAELRESPYFSRIDLREDGEAEAEPFYIGRFSFAMGERILITDWRPPVAGMFYDWELGPAGYDAPVGRIRGELTRKRQFKITGGRMEYALESSLGIRDEVLQRELSGTADDKMKIIIATLQREQNKIIRNESAHTIIIQGVAGSGKTSIALHRIAYLLYRHGDSLSAKNIAILSPNKVFGDYISNVLPELGEEPVYGMSFVDVARIQLDGVVDFADEKDLLEADDTAYGVRYAFKSTLDFIIRLDDYKNEMENHIFAPADYTFGRFTATGEWIMQRYRAYHKLPVARRLEEVAGDIRDKFETENIREDELPAQRAILGALRRMLTVKSTLELYKGFYRRTGRPELFAMLDRRTLEWPDFYPFLYLHAFYAGLRQNRLIRHVVVDEMQDYTPVQFEVINRMFSCPKTILGDFGQSIRPHNGNSLDAMEQMYPHGKVVVLRKSYRSSYEIIRFAAGIRPDTPVEPVELHGEEPEWIRCRDDQEQIALIKELASAFRQSGYDSMGIITKTNAAAKALHSALKDGTDINLITPESHRFEGGVSIVSAAMSKGLEFDQVVLYAADSRSYCTPQDRGLLYVACTRAMHRLTLTYCETPTTLAGVV